LGFNALVANTIGNDNTASGTFSLNSNTSGSNNTASGVDSLASNVGGNDNTAAGNSALASNLSGNDNTASGYSALYSNTTGSNNIGLGYRGGLNVTTGSNNIEIGNEGTSGDSGIIRIGTAGSQKEVFIAGVENSKITGSAVYVTASGRLGVLASSERYKTAIAPIGSDTAKLQELRPMKFHLKTDPYGAIQYGLIAEEVAKVYPELVVRDKNGRIDGVRYDELAPMLLNEMQKEQATVATLVTQHEADAAKIDQQSTRIASLEQQLAGIQVALSKLQPTDKLVAQR
jgi:hypothetical protein